MPVYRFEDMEDIQHNPDLSSGHGETVEGERIFFGKRTKPPGTGSKPHHHPSEQFFYILSGGMAVVIEGERSEAGPGGVIHIPANAVHHTEVLGGEAAIYLYVKDTSWDLTGLAAGEGDLAKI